MEKAEKIRKRRWKRRYKKHLQANLIYLDQEVYQNNYVIVYKTGEKPKWFPERDVSEGVKLERLGKEYLEPHVSLTIAWLHCINNKVYADLVYPFTGKKIRFEAGVPKLRGVKKSNSIPEFPPAYMLVGSITNDPKKQQKTFNLVVADKRDYSPHVFP